MALKSNRVGVRADQVDAYGRVISKSFFQSILDHLSRWTSLKVWKNGTEQLLPVNTDEPVTSPIVADIQYPTDSSATEQMFTYRESPTEVDGEAYIKSIKGNTLVWNQLVVDTYIPVATGTYSWAFIGSYSKNKELQANHVYLLTSDNSELSVRFRNESISVITQGGQNLIYKATTTDNHYYVQGDGTTTKESHINYYDLTAMFGSTKADEIYAMETAQAGSGVEYFKSLFPLSYYKYDAGSLLSFNGTGIKTVGKNRMPLNEFSMKRGTVYTFEEPLEKGVYTLSLVATRTPEDIDNRRSSFRIYYTDNSTQQIYFRPNGTVQSDTVTFTKDVASIYVYSIAGSYEDSANYTLSVTDMQIEKGSVATSYEPYTTSTTTIPTDTYFPTGMKSARNAYDEFTSSRAYTRIGTVDLGTLNWVKWTGVQKGFYAPLGTAKGSLQAELTNAICVEYEVALYSNVVAGLVDKSFAIASSTRYIYLYDSTYDESTAADFKTAVSGVIMYYELKEEIIEPTLEFDEE